MTYLKRSFYSLLYHKVKVLLIIIIFSVIFIVIVSGFMMYTSSQKVIRNIKNSVGNSVTLKGIDVYDRSAGFTGWTYGIDFKDLDKFVQSEYVAAYNYYDFAFVTFKNIKRYEGNKEKYDKTKVKLKSSSPVMDGSLYGLIDSSYDTAFTVNGYRLVQGRHITSEDSEQNICLISKELAELNHLELGDVIEATNNTRHFTYSLTVAGIFSTPDGEYLTGFGSSPAEIIFMPVSTMKAYLEQNNFKQKGPMNACVYLKNPSCLDAFIQEVKSKLNIQNVLYSHFNNTLQIPEEFVDWAPSDVSEYYSENHWYNLQLDHEWYDMIASPIENVNRITEILIVGIISGAIVILILICILYCKGRNREFGILLAMGEKKSRIIAQMITELFIPVVLAACIGLLGGISYGSSFINRLSNDVYHQKAEELSKENQQVLYRYMQEDLNATDLGWNHDGLTDLLFKSSGRITIQANAEPELDAVTYFNYLLLIFGLVFVIIMIQMVFILRCKPAAILRE